VRYVRRVALGLLIVGSVVVLPPGSARAYPLPQVPALIEALSAAVPTRLVGSSCTPMPDGIRPGENKAVLAEPFKLHDPPVGCNPRWE
jgi:hypothetical protein